MDNLILNILLLLLILSIIAGIFVLNRWRQKDHLQDQQLLQLVEGTAGSTGEAFLYGLVRELSLYLKVDTVMIVLNSANQLGEYTSLACWQDESYRVNYNINLTDVSFNQDGSCYFESGAAELLANSNLLKQDYRPEGLSCDLLQDSAGKTIGLLLFMDRSKLVLTDKNHSIVKTFTLRAAAELERNLMLNNILHEKERTQITLQSISDGVISTDDQGHINSMNPTAERLTGWRQIEAMGLPLESVFHLEDELTGEVIPDPALHCLQEKRVISPKTENILVAKTGSRFSIQGSAAPIMDNSGNGIGVVLVFKDVSDSRRWQKKMMHQATHDSLTGLVNRAEFEQRLEKSLNSARSQNLSHALLYLDLDRFKQVNDTAGHVAGDELLRQISAMLLDKLRARDTLGRLGGDEFSVLLENCPLDKARSVAEILLDTICDFHFIWEKKTYRVSVSIGIVAITESSVSQKQVMNHADLACYNAKDLGRGRIHIYTNQDEIKSQPSAQNLTASDLHEAMQNDRFQLYYQPVIVLQSKYQSLTHAEILLRLTREKGELVLPGAFIPAAERFNIMAQLDRWVIHTLFQQYAHVFVQNPDLLLSINISASSVGENDFAEFVKLQFEQSVVEPSQVCFEFAETLVINQLPDVNKLLQKLKTLGCFCALDDFGSGLSSFSYLKKLPLDFLKIDGVLTRDLSSDSVDLAMVKSINDMAHMLGLETIAENADNETIIELLKEAGVDHAQGFYLANPVSMSELDVFLDSESSVSKVKLN